MSKFIVLAVFIVLRLSSWNEVSGQAEFYPFGELQGDVFVPAQDDGSSPLINLNQSFTFYGVEHDFLYVSTNGVISFEDAFTNCCDRNLPARATSPPFLTPFWHDIDISRSGNISYHQTSDPDLLQRAHSELMLLERDAFTPTLLFVVTYDSVAPFGGDFDPINGFEETTFQAVLATDGEGSSTVIFLYGDIEWGDGATVGFNAGDGFRYLEVNGSQTNQTFSFNSRSNVGTPGLFVFSADFQGVLFQLRLTGIHNCFKWVHATNTSERLDDVIRELVVFAASACGCTVTPAHVTNAAFQCFEGSEDTVTFRAEISGTTDISPFELLDVIADWVESDPVINVQGVRLPLDGSCSPLIDSFNDPECMAESTERSELSISRPTIILAVVLGVVIIISVVIIVALIVVNRRRQHHPVTLAPPPRDQAQRKEQQLQSAKNGYESRELRQTNISVSPCPAYGSFEQIDEGHMYDVVGFEAARHAQPQAVYDLVKH